MGPAAQAAQRRAFDDAAAPTFGAPSGRTFTVRRAVGDPQAPLETFLALLDRRALLGSDGRLLPHVQLVSMGDHFDWGRTEERARVSAESQALFAWLCAHPSDQVVVLLGNHDLARVCDLHGFTGARFEEALALAQAAYREGDPDPEAERTFQARYPMFPTAEVVARDWASFEPSQSALVEGALAAGRVKLAHADDAQTLLLHAGVTRPTLAALAVREDADAFHIARALNVFLHKRFVHRGDGPLDLSPLHVPGSAATGEGRGIFFHRACHPEQGAPRPGRAFDPRDLPPGLTQIIGHVQDAKSRKLLGPWADSAAPTPGVLRQLVVADGQVHYAHGTWRVPEGAAALVFTDGGMLRTPLERYQLLDLDARAPG